MRYRMHLQYRVHVRERVHVPNRVRLRELYHTDWSENADCPEHAKQAGHDLHLSVGFVRKSLRLCARSLRRSP